jgi:hypothetical protein
MGAGIHALAEYRIKTPESPFEGKNAQQETRILPGLTKHLLFVTWKRPLPVFGQGGNERNSAEKREFREHVVCGCVRIRKISGNPQFQKNPSIE